MRRTLVQAVAASGGVISREAALAIAPRHVVADAVSDGALVRMFPRVYAVPEDVERADVRRTGALLCIPDAALSHVDALAVWNLPSEPVASAGAGAIHLTCPGRRSDVDIEGLRVHRRLSFRPDPPSIVVRRGLRVVRIEQAIVESWPMLRPLGRRAPAIVAVREGRTTGARLLATLEQQARTSGAAEMRQLFRLLQLGIRSELEAWGHARVFCDPRLPRSRAQVPVKLVSGRTVYLDRLFDEEMVNVELDGAAYHGAPGQRERDLRRDSALAALGFVTVRLTHPRLHADPSAAIEELLLTLATRRRQLGVRGA